MVCSPLVRCWLVLLLGSFAPLLPAVDRSPALVDWDELASRPVPAGGQRIEYGPAKQQFAELRVPPGVGPFPVVMLVHGGCWLNHFDYRYFTQLAAAITRDLGVATWTPEYRRVGDRDGGWPATLTDVGDALDHLRRLARDHPLDPGRVVAVGHSAGAHLSLWLAIRSRLPSSSALYRPQPLPLRGVVGVAPVADIEAFQRDGPGSCSGVITEMLGGSAGEQPRRYAEASPSRFLPLGVPQWMVHGQRDAIVPVALTRAYVAAASAKGDRVVMKLASQAGHFDPVAPETGSAADVMAAVREALR